MIIILTRLFRFLVKPVYHYGTVVDWYKSVSYALKFGIYFVTIIPIVAYSDIGSIYVSFFHYTVNVRTFLSFVKDFSIGNGKRSTRRYCVVKMRFFAY